ncbi:MAG: 50S ribosomal protein L9 [Candidatus Omnitrophica bacterium]|nr:50S ribosomal protein L9 [Candidatus Omnitrophota bacterium]MDD5654769.1 50S ribosomal protein L9 [Candidatus Omnitrophota bacterium]
MEVILKQDIKGVGKAGDKIKVKVGFARNYLLPNGLALPLTNQNLKILEEDKKRKAMQTEKMKAAALDLVKKLSGLSVNVAVSVQEDEKLYGSVSAQNIYDALKEEGVEIDKRSIILPEPIKSLGIYDVPVKLHPEVETTIKVWVVKK